MNSHFPMTLKLFDADIYDASILDTFRLEKTAVELSGENWMYLAGLVKRYRPRTLLEVGVSAGGSSALLLHILDKLGLESELVSVDLRDRWYKDSRFEVGWAAKKLYPEKKNWHLHVGKFLPEIIENFNTEFDFCFLDTAHRLPGELLDYLVVLPFMREGGIIAMHDTALYYKIEGTLATRILISVCGGKKLLPPQNSKNDANMCAFQITEDTYKNIENVFSALALPWEYFIDDRQMKIYHDFFLRYYGSDAAAWFSQVREWNTAHFLKVFRGQLKHSGKDLARGAGEQRG